MSIWYIILIAVMVDGKVNVDVYYPNSPQYNDEKSCNQVADYKTNEEQLRIGTNAGTVFYICKEITGETIKKATGAGTGL